MEHNLFGVRAFFGVHIFMAVVYMLGVYASPQGKLCSEMKMVKANNKYVRIVELDNGIPCEWDRGCVVEMLFVEYFRKFNN